MFVVWRKCKISNQKRSMFRGTQEECQQFKLDILNGILVETLNVHPEADEDTILLVEDGYFQIVEE